MALANSLAYNRQQLQL